MKILTAGVLNLPALDRQKAIQIAKILTGQPGLNRLTVNAVAGQIILHYDPEEYGLAMAINRLRQAGYKPIRGRHGL